MSDYKEPLTDEEAERVERGLRRLLNTPPKPHGKNPKASARPRMPKAQPGKAKSPKSRAPG